MFDRFGGPILVSQDRGEVETEVHVGGGVWHTAQVGRDGVVESVTAHEEIAQVVMVGRVGRIEPQRRGEFGKSVVGSVEGGVTVAEVVADVGAIGVEPPGVYEKR